VSETPQEAKPLIRQLDETMEMVAAARERLGEGETVDLSGLQAKVEMLCAACAGAPRAETAPHGPRLLGLIDEIGKLEADVKTQYEELKGVLTGVDARHRATRAYAKGPGRKAPGRKG